MYLPDDNNFMAWYRVRSLVNYDKSMLYLQQKQWKNEMKKEKKKQMAKKKTMR